jgi:hypothetical protein
MLVLLPLLARLLGLHFCRLLLLLLVLLLRSLRRGCQQANPLLLGLPLCCCLCRCGVSSLGHLGVGLLWLLLLWLLLLLLLPCFVLLVCIVSSVTASTAAAIHWLEHDMPNVRCLQA